METIHRIGFGGGCHWCTEAVYNSLKGIISVEQGFVASEGEESSFSEAVIVRYDPINISLEDLILIHLYTHKSTSNHSMRKKYRSAIYTFETVDDERCALALQKFQEIFESPLITKVLPFKEFRISDKEIHYLSFVCYLSINHCFTGFSVFFFVAKLPFFAYICCRIVAHLTLIQHIV